MRVVLDTNVLLSACLKPEGLEARVVELAFSGALQACVSSAILHEYVEVLRRDKFRAVCERAIQVLEKIEACALCVAPPEAVQVSMDDDDNRFLECAAAAGAEFLITGNLRHYPSEWASAKVVNARGFLEAYDIAACSMARAKPTL